MGIQLTLRGYFLIYLIIIQQKVDYLKEMVALTVFTTDQLVFNNVTFLLIILGRISFLNLIFGLCLIVAIFKHFLESSSRQTLLVLV